MGLHVQVKLHSLASFAAPQHDVSNGYADHSGGAQHLIRSILLYCIQEAAVRATRKSPALPGAFLF